VVVGGEHVHRCGAGNALAERFRFALGLGEAGVWPAASKAVAEWFPARERALAIGVYTMGATVGATVAPYVVIPAGDVRLRRCLPVAGRLARTGTGWRIAFLLTGLLGLVWLVPWLGLYRLPQTSKWITPGERRMIEASADAERPADPADEQAWGWGRVLRFRGTWLLLLGRLITDPVWYFYQFWFPKYLSADRQLSQDQLTVTWIVYAAAGVGSLAGGWLSGRLIKRGMAPASSRLWVMLGCACLMPLSPFIARVSGLNLALALTVVTVLASLAWLINLSSLVVDLVPAFLGTVFSSWQQAAPSAPSS
jgi:ACS family hexuronate transporter-like MFS transporter